MNTREEMNHDMIDMTDLERREKETGMGEEKIEIEMSRMTEGKVAVVIEVAGRIAQGHLYDHTGEAGLHLPTVTSHADTGGTAVVRDHTTPISQQPIAALLALSLTIEIIKEHIHNDWKNVQYNVIGTT